MHSASPVKKTVKRKKKGILSWHAWVKDNALNCADTTWHNYAMTRIGAKVTMYYDGVPFK